MKHPPSLSGFTPPHLLSRMAENTPILIALSGGADSVALLRLLSDYAKKTGAPLAIAHVNHKLRGADADVDRDFCRALADAYELPFYLLETDVKTLAIQNRRGIEEQARLVRYEFFATLMAEHNIPLLATAHHADDNAETLLLHITRGSGLRGLRGISPVRDFASGKLIRPLLTATKSDILAFCEQNAIAYVIDKTNDDTDYARNRIRHEVMPALRRVNPATVESMTRLCRTVARDDDFLSTCADEFLAAHQSEDGTLPLAALNGAHLALAARAVAKLLAAHVEEVASLHVESILSLAEKGTPHASLDLGNGMQVRIEDGRLSFEEAKPSEPKAYDYLIPLHEGENPIPEVGMMILVEHKPSQKNHEAYQNIYKKATTTHISSDKIYDSFVARPRREGDLILTNGMHKRVKKLMCDRKVPLPLRPRLPFVCDADGILWIPLTALRDGSAGNGMTTVTLFYND